MELHRVALKPASTLWKGMSPASWACTFTGLGLLGLCAWVALALAWGLATGGAYDEGAPIVVFAVVGMAGLGVAMAAGPWLLRDNDQSPEATGRPGWYPDRGRPGSSRWFDGQRWTDECRPGQGGR
jgi:Protein of unknown function (DUF2510)